MVVWKNIPGYDGKYQIDINGNVQRVYPSGKTRMMTSYHKKNMGGSRRLVVNLTKDGKAKEERILQLMAKTFLGDPPPGCVPYHKNGIQLDNHICNIAYISKRELGKITGAKANRKPVVKLDSNGDVIAFYSSAKEAGDKNYMSKHTVSDICNDKRKSVFAADGYIYAWDDEKNIKKVMKKLKQEKEERGKNGEKKNWK